MPPVSLHRFACFRPLLGHLASQLISSGSAVLAEHICAQDKLLCSGCCNYFEQCMCL